MYEQLIKEANQTAREIVDILLKLDENIIFMLEDVTGLDNHTIFDWYMCEEDLDLPDIRKIQDFLHFEYDKNYAMEGC